MRGCCDLRELRESALSDRGAFSQPGGQPNGAISCAALDNPDAKEFSKSPRFFLNNLLKIR
jgi:hypothetical protein